MPERLPPYSPEQPTPRQLNAELLSVLDLLPKESIEDEAAALQATGLKLPDDDDYEQLVRRRRLYSGYGEMVMGRVYGLVRKAPITEHFQEYIFNAFVDWQEWGIEPDRDPKDIDRDLFFLDRSDPDSGGVFDPKRAVNFEREALRREKWSLKSMERGGLAIESSEAHIEIGFSTRRWFENLRPWKEEVADWEVQFNRHYGQEASA